MLTISQLNTYASGLPDAIPEIKRVEQASDPDELAKILNDQKENSILLVSIFPDHDVSGQQHALEWENICAFLVLEKTDYSKGRAVLHQVFERTEAVAKKIATQIVIENQDNPFGIMRKLDLSSISVSLIRMMNQCNGYQVSFTVNTDF